MSAISAVAGRASPLVYSPSNPKLEIIKNVVSRSLLELAVCLTVCAAISFFVTPIALSYLVSCVLLQCLLSFAVRSVEAILSYNNMMTSGFANSALVARTSAFSWTTAPQAQTLIHEMGHATAASLAYKNARAQIQIIPFRGGSTSFYYQTLSFFGKLLGPVGALAFVTAAGAGLTLLVSGVLLWLSQYLRRSHPEISAYLFSYSTSDFLMHASYALSAFWANPTDLSHDFVRLSTLTGLSPLVALVIIVATPFLIYHATARYRTPPQPPALLPCYINS